MYTHKCTHTLFTLDIHVITTNIVNTCEDNCIQTVHQVSESDIWMTRKRFTGLSSIQQRQWVLDYLHTNTNSESMITMFTVCGKKVCLPVWLAILGLSRSRFYEVRQIFTSGGLQIERLVSPKCHQTKSLNAIAWMDLYFNQIGDHLPDKMAIHLPSFLTNKMIYERLISEFRAKGEDHISSSHFYKLWSEEFPHVSIPKVCQ